MQKFCSIILICIISYLFSGCSPWERKPFYEADISGVSIDTLQLNRYEEVLFNANPFILYEELKPYFEEFYFFLGEGIHEPEGQLSLYDYVTDPFLIEIYLDSKEVWADTEELRNSLYDAFRFYRHHFPGEDIPSIYTYISGIDYNMPVKYDEGHLVLALDTYLGADYHYYDKLAIPRYRSRWMRPELLPVDAMRMMADKHLGSVAPMPETLLEHMVHAGKKQYFLDCMFPRMHDSLKINLTAVQLDWMERHEGLVWTYKLDNELLYSTDHGAITQFTRDAPFTAPFSRESAPRTGVWLGWQIVRAYMRRNPDVGLQELIHETDARKILVNARYRPR